MTILFTRRAQALCGRRTLSLHHCFGGGGGFPRRPTGCDDFIYEKGTGAVRAKHPQSPPLLRVRGVDFREGPLGVMILFTRRAQSLYGRRVLWGSPRAPLLWGGGQIFIEKDH